ncbi:MAG: DbpA RNA binding domain-containing protein [Muribaculaceae bacterium]|nr:DbpA RNA binding domain-containing protein [Muribaculaceae bacterium]
MERTEIGLIKVYDHYALATVPAKHLRTLTEALRQMRLKGKKVRVTEVCTLR